MYYLFGGATACCWVVAVQGMEGGEDVIWTAFHVETNHSLTNMSRYASCGQTGASYTGHV